jgi:dinuclear metal center YbgI/SA1388 family protein
MTTPNLPAVVELLETLVPLRLAADWDNVGLLLGALEPDGHRVPRVLLTIDLTEAVVAEAIENGAALVVAYHPPIFRPLARLLPNPGVERAVLRAARHGLPIWSPHTALDAMAGGVNDWLADGLATLGAASREAIERPDGCDDPLVGQGRLVTFSRPVALDTVVAAIKQWLDLPGLRVARSSVGPDDVRSVALCPGAGGSVISAAKADVLWTGEMRHHDVLAANATGRHAVLCEHTNTERGYLRRFAETLGKAAGDRGLAVEVAVAASDHDPHEIR